MPDTGYRIWLFAHYPFRHTDERIHPYLTIPAPSAVEAWLKPVRQALFLSVAEVARRLELSRNTYSQIETREEQGQITLKVLREAAEAMDCEVVCFVRPKKSATLFSQVVWQKLFAEIESHPMVKNASAPRRPHVEAGFAGYKMRDPRFRRRCGWSQR